MFSIDFSFPPKNLSTGYNNNSISNNLQNSAFNQKNITIKNTNNSTRNKPSDKYTGPVIENRNPTPNENLPVGTVWINKTTGEVFICVDDTPNSNRWVGSFGTVIEPSPFYVVDFFKDNSIIAFYRFNSSTKDDTGIYHGFKLGATSYSKGKFDKALDFGDIPNDINAFTVKNIELHPQMNFSFWVYKYYDNFLNPYISLAYANIYNAILLFEHKGLFKIIIDNKLYSFQKSKLVPSHQWVFISFNILKNPNKIELFINGEYVDTVYYITDFKLEKYSYNNCLIFGQDQDTYCGGFETTQSFLGKLDQFRIFNRPLTKEEIRALFNEQP